MPRVRSRWLIAVLGVAVAVAFAVGWQAPRSPPGTMSVDAPVEFVRGNNADPESLDPLHGRSEPALNILRDLHEGLTTLDSSGEVVPGAARSWQTSADGLEWTFELDPHAQWSDGQAVTAGDFVTAFRALADPAVGSPHAGLFDAIEGIGDAFAGRAALADIGVIAESERRLRIGLLHPIPWLPDLLAHPAASPRRTDVPPDGRVSSGAFRFSARVPGSDLVLERNPAYRDVTSVAIDRVRYVPVSDHASELSRYRAGELDMSYTVPVSRVPWLRENLADELRISPYLAVYFYGFNTRQPPLDDPRLRRALSLVIDRELIASRIVGAGESPACTLVPPGIPDYVGPWDAACEARRRERLEYAQALFAAAGYGAERPLHLEIRHNPGELHDRIAVAVSSMWKDALGVEISLVREEFRVLIGNVRAGEVTQVYRGSWIADFAEPESFLGILAADSPVNSTGWADATYDRMLGEAALRDDRAARLELLAEAEALAMQAAPLMPLYFYVSKKLVKPHVRGIEDNPLNVHPSRFVRLCRGDDADC